MSQDKRNGRDTHRERENLNQRGCSGVHADGGGGWGERGDLVGWRDSELPIQEVLQGGGWREREGFESFGEDGREEGKEGKEGGSEVTNAQYGFEQLQNFQGFVRKELRVEPWKGMGRREEEMSVRSYVCACVRAYACACVRASACMCVHARACTRVCVSVYLYLCLCLPLSRCLCLCLCPCPCPERERERERKREREEDREREEEKE